MAVLLLLTAALLLRRAGMFLQQLHTPERMAAIRTMTQPALHLLQHTLMRRLLQMHLLVVLHIPMAELLQTRAGQN